MTYTVGWKYTSQSEMNYRTFSEYTGQEVDAGVDPCVIEVLKVELNSKKNETKVAEAKKCQCVRKKTILDNKIMAEKFAEKLAKLNVFLLEINRGNMSLLEDCVPDKF